MTYNEIENKITDLNKEISILNKSIVKNIKNINDFSSILQNQNQPQVNIEDYRMLQTVTTFLPLMVLFYNSVELINQPTQPQIINRVSHEEGDGYHDNDNENENEEFLRKLRDPTNIYLSLD
jgi:hypothetical protein